MQERSPSESPTAAEALVLLIVDDEQHARKALRCLAESRPEIGDIVEVGNAHAAVEVIRRIRPQIMFLDVQMPGADGMSVLETLDPEELPLVVFVTAHEAHAVKAFERGVVDYLLKPFSDARFHQALDRVLDRRKREKASDVARRMRLLLEEMEEPPPSLDGNDVSIGSRRIALKTGSRVEVIPIEDIAWIEGADVYVRVHARERSFLVREKLERLADQLEGHHFVRVHRSAVVNFNRVVRIQRDDRGRHQVMLQDGTAVRVSRSGKKLLDERLGGA